MKFNNIDTYALALGGGGARGAYEIGVWKALREHNIKIGAVCGTSIGAINGALIAQGDYEKSEEVWLNMGPEEIYNSDSNLLIDKIRDISKLRGVLEKYISEEKIRKSEIEFGIVTVNLTTRTPMVLFTKDIPNGKMIDYILASANYPTFYRQEIDGQKYIDGGIYDNLPRAQLEKRGYKNIIEVDINPPLSNVTKKKVKSSTNLHTIISKHYLYGQFIFSKEKIENNIEKGYMDTKLYNDEYISSHYYIKDTNEDISLNKEDIKYLLNHNIFKEVQFSDEDLKTYINCINNYYKEKNGYFDGNIAVHDKRFIIACFEITAYTLGVNPFKEYSYREFLESVCREIYKLLGEKDKIESTLENGIFNINLISEMNDINIDRKALLAILMFATNRLSLLETIVYKTMPKIVISFIFSFIAVRRLKENN